MPKTARILLICLCMLLCPAIGAARENHEVSELLDSLRYSLSHHDEAQERLNQNFEDLKARRLRSAGHERVTIGELLAHKYIVENIDSALYYYELAATDASTLKDTVAQMCIDMQIYAMLPLMGATREAINMFEQYSYDSLPPEVRGTYWRTAAELYHGAQIPYPQGPYKEYYRNRSLVAIDSMTNYYPEDSPVRSYLQGQAFLMRGDLNLAVASFADAIHMLTDHPELTDFALKMMSEYYKGRPDYEQVYLGFLLRRTIATLNRGLVRPDLLAQTGGELMERGHKYLGRKCISLALETSDRSYAGPYRTFDRARYAHYLTDEASTLRNTRVAFICIVVLLAIVGIYIIARLRIALREARREGAECRKRAEAVMEQARLTNESVITLAFVALDQQKEYGLHVARKLKAGQYKDLIAESESGKYEQRQSEKYFEVFDSTFLNNFPYFIDKLNALLQPERRLSLLANDRLSPELRIAAFMRLGVVDSTKLSEVLDLSLNTIYTYRNRLKGRALDRDTFEENVKKIGPDYPY